MRRFLTALLAMLLAAPCAAQAPARRSGGWRDTLEPERRLGHMYLHGGLVRLLDAMGREAPELGDAPRYLLLNQALVRFERARRRIPEDPELAFYTAMALTLYRSPAPDGGQERRVDEAIDAWHALRAAHPTFLPQRVALELAALHMQRQEFTLARAEYEAALRDNVPPTVDPLHRFFLPAVREDALADLFRSPAPAHVHGNLAEAAMLTGDVSAALHHYRIARAETESPITRVLAAWGLALALDRSGQHDEALAATREAIEGDPLRGDPQFTELYRAHGHSAVLHLEGVFFEPRCEIHAYEALGHEAMSRVPGDEDPREHLRRALRSWRFFLAEGGNASRFAPVARRHVERLAGEVEPAANPPARPRGRAVRRAP